MTINWMPEHFNQRRPKTSYLLGQAIGESLGKASDMYLKGKMENYFQNQKDERASKIEQAASERSAEGYEKLTGIKGLKDHLRGIPLQHHGAAVKEFGGGGAQDYINNASPSYQTSPPPPQPPPSPQKTSTSINQDIAAAQRMGLSGQEVPGMPGIPAKTPQGVNEPQQAEGDREQPQIPGGQVRSKMSYPLAEMSNDEFNNTLRQYPGATNKKLLINAREKQRDQRLKEEGLENQEKRTDIAERSDERAERKFQNDLKKDLAKSKELTKEDREFVKSINSQNKGVFAMKKALSDMREIREEHKVNMFTGITHEGRKARAQYNLRAKDILGGFSKLFKTGGFTDREFNTIQKLWIPKAGETQGTIEGKELGLEKIAEASDKMYQILMSHQNEDGSYPRNIENIVNSEMQGTIDDLKRFLLPKKTEGSSDTMFKPSELEEGARVRDKETGKIYVNRNGQLTEES